MRPGIGSHRSSVRTAAPLDTPISITGVRRVINSRVKVVEEAAVTAEMRVLQMQPGVYSRSILSARTYRSRRAAFLFFDTSRLVIICTDSGIFCETVSGAFGTSRGSSVPEIPVRGPIMANNSAKCVGSAN